MPGQPPPALRAPGAPVGLYNEGATCYLNALLQLLFMLPVREAILKWRPDESDDASGDDASGDDASPPAAPSADLEITGELQRLFARLVLGDARAASTRDLVAAFGWSGAEALEQQDVSECLNVLCDRGFHGSARAALDELCGGTTVTVLERKDGTRPPRSGEPAPPGVRDGGERAAKRGGDARPASRSAGGIGARPQVKFLELHLGLDRPTVEAALAAYFAGDDPRGFPPDFDASVFEAFRRASRARRGPSIRPNASRIDADATELERVLECGGFPPDRSLDSTQATTSRSTARRRASASPTRSARRSRRRPARSSSR